MEKASQRGCPLAVGLGLCSWHGPQPQFAQLAFLSEAVLLGEGTRGDWALLYALQAVISSAEDRRIALWHQIMINWERSPLDFSEGLWVIFILF